MPKTIDIDVHHVTRIEGHGNIRIQAVDGKVNKVEWQVPEAPRFFEAMLRGRSWQEVQTVVSRICGICSFAHSLAAIKAVESALGIEISEQTDRLRMLAFGGEQLESHILHIGYLVAPDLVGVSSVVSLVKSHPEVVAAVIRAHRLGNEWMELLGGRRTHPVSFRPGGFGKLPKESELKELTGRLEQIVPDLSLIAQTVAALASRLPAFDRPTEYVALVEPGVYTFYHGMIGSTDAPERLPVDRFEQVANEYLSPQSTAKWTRWHRDSYAVGALARFNLNHSHLHPLATRTGTMLGLKPPCCNPYMNSVAQVVEAVEVVEAGMEQIDALLTCGIKSEAPRKPKLQAGSGVGAVEAPRGTLFHKYAFDGNGICTTANICIPTNQNHANIQKDFEAMLPIVIDRDETEIRLLLEMLVRAYDPCVSCSTH
ncbi:MAG: nickel-dependent hydrogenase large subunit [Planctomycetota bacterium]|nr:nickel-dependent hydrogenase large subunit [Planctomycetota bacterium]